MLAALAVVAFAVAGVADWLSPDSTAESVCAAGSVVVHTGDDTTVCVPPR